MTQTIADKGRPSRLDRADEALRQALLRKTGGMGQALLFALAVAAFYWIALRARYAGIEEYFGGDPASRIRLTAMVYSVIYAISLAVQLRLFRGLSLGAKALMALLTLLVLMAKVSLLDYESDDYQIFLSGWVYRYSMMGFKEGLGTYIESDYTPPYLYLLQIISRLHSYPWHYMIKAWSIFFEVLLCYAVTGLASMKLRGDGARLAVWQITSLLPTVVFNGAYWGQCDVIYTSLSLMGLLFGMRGRSARSMICFGLALSFKLQTVFFLPVLLPLWLRRELKLRTLPLIPCAYMAMMIPALWGGKSLHHVLTVYLQQASGYNLMTINGTSLWHLLPTSEALPGKLFFQLLSPVAMWLAFAALGLMCLLLLMRRERLTQEGVLLFCLLGCSLIPYLLPKMHERYTFGADVLSVAVAAHQPRLAILPLLYGLASYICYTGGLPGHVILPLRFAALIQGTAVLIAAIALWRSLNVPRGMEVKG